MKSELSSTGWELDWTSSFKAVLSIFRMPRCDGMDPEAYVYKLPSSSFFSGTAEEVHLRSRSQLSD